MESDSELLVQSNSLFNRIEGIKAGRAKSGNVEMGGAGASLTGQDGQDS